MDSLSAIPIALRGFSGSIGGRTKRTKDEKVGRLQPDLSQFIRFLLLFRLVVARRRIWRRFLFPADLLQRTEEVGFREGDRIDFGSLSAQNRFREIGRGRDRLFLLHVRFPLPVLLRAEAQLLPDWRWQLNLISQLGLFVAF